MSRTRSVVGGLTLLALTVAVAAAALSASAAQSDAGHSAAHGLVGTWDVALMLPGAPPGRVLATFTSDGGTVESASTPPALRGASHGVWERRGPDLFSVTRVFFRFDQQTGAFLGTTKVNATVRVAPDGETFNAVSVSELRNPQGQVVAAGLRGAAIGTRMNVEPIPDQP